MRPHWNDVKKTFRALAYLVKNKDLDEIELFFTNDTGTHGRHKNTKPLLDILNLAEPSGSCDIGVAFEKLLDGLDLAHKPEAKKTLRPWKKKKKDKEKYGTSIYILTDAIWQDGWKEGIVDPIKALMKKGLKKGQLGVQFIQFGEHSEGSDRLDILDRGLYRDGVTKWVGSMAITGLQLTNRRDIIDTEPCDGNVLKMLLGSFDPTWDGDPPRDSPDSPRHVTEQDKSKDYG